MSGKFQEERICDQCGSRVPDDSPGGLCLKCVASGVLGSESADAWMNPPDNRTGEIIGSWEILARIGEGAFGEVFHVAENTKGDDREGALKLLKEGMCTREALARFDAEQKALAKLDHPNITRILDTGETADGQPWFVMEYIDGEPVTDYCRLRKLSIRKRLEIFHSICEAVDHAHENGIVHRDLKPSNVLVANAGDTGPVAKLIDFGVAKAVSQPLTQKTLFTHSGVLIGTPEYMSPEQAAGKSLDLDARSDVYSLGVLLYELLTGTTPITSARLREAAFDEILRLVRETEADRPSSVQTDNRIAADLDWIALKALEKNRDRRYADSGELAADIGLYLDARPVSARKPGALYLASRRLKRHRTAVIGVSIATGCALLAAAAGWWWSQQSTAISPALLAASEFRPAPMPSGLPDTPAPEDPDAIESSVTIENYPDVLARLCRRLRDDPDDDHARFRLWGLLTVVQHPERIGDPIVAGGKITGAHILPGRGVAVVISEDGTFRAVSIVDGSEVFRHDCGTPLANLVFASEDGITAASGENGSLFVFDFANEFQMQQFFAGTSPVKSLALSPDGRILLSGDESGSLKAWPVSIGGNPKWTITLGSAVQFLTAHPEEPAFACGLENGDVMVLGSREGASFSPVLKTGEALAGIGFSKKEGELISVTRSGVTQIWDYPSGLVSETFQNPDPAIPGSFVADTDDGLFLVGSDRGAIVRQMSAPEDFAHAPTGSAVLSVDVYTRDPGYLATGHADGTWRLWNERYRRSEDDPVLFQPDIPVRHLSVDFETLKAIVAGGTEARMWDVWYRPTKLSRYQEAGYVTEMAVIPGTQLVRFLGPNGSILFKLESTVPFGQAIPLPLGSDHTALSDDGLWISAAYGNRVHTWKAPITSEAIPMREIQLHSAVSALGLGPEGATVAIGTEKGSGGVWQPHTGRRLLKVNLDSGQEIRAAAVDDQFAAFGMSDGSVRIFSLESQRELEPGMPSFESPVDRLEISSRGTIAAGARDGTGRLFDPLSGKQIGNDLHHSGGIISLDFSHDGRWLTCGTRSKYCALWDARDGRYLYRSRRWIGEMVLAGMNPEQTHLIQCSTRASGPTFQRIPPHNEPVPPVLLDYAEGFAGFRFDENGEKEAIPFLEYDRVRSAIIDLPEDGSRVRHWMRFIAQHPTQRRSTPDW